METKLLIVGIIAIILIVALLFVLSPYIIESPDVLPGQEVVTDCQEDLDCFALKRASCLPARYTGSDAYGDILMEVKGREAGGCRIQIDYNESFFEQLSGKSMVCLFPEGMSLESMLQAELSDYCNGPLVAAMAEVGQEMRASLDNQYAFGTTCTPGFYSTSMV